MEPKTVEREPVTREYDWTIDSPCFAVIDAIARYEGTETTRMTEQLPPLQHTLDLDALDSLLGNCATLDFSFTYAGYHVRVTDETVTVADSKPTSD